MAEITASLVKELREKTGAAMMACKKALNESGGDLDAAADILRKKSLAKADTKASRAAGEGVVASKVCDSGKGGVLVEVNCETDFVAKNENFTAIVEKVAEHVATNDVPDSTEALLAQPFASDTSQTLGEFIKVKIVELGENIVIPRLQKYMVESNGAVGSYIHMQGRVGVLVELTSEKSEIAGNESVNGLLKDIAMHIAASQPISVGRDGVDSTLIEKEREIYADQVKDKPANIIEKIVEGKVDKYYSQICLLEQAFIKDTDKTISQLLEDKSKELGDTITVKRFERYAVGG